MDYRATNVLRIVTIVLVIAIAAVGVLLVSYLIADSGDTTPRTELERAVIAAEEAVRANPESAPSRIKLAAAYLESGALAAAREQADIAIRLSPDDPEGPYILGLIESKDGDHKAAIVQFRKAVGAEGQLAAFYQDVWRSMSSAYERSGDTSQAIGAMDEALNFGPENAELLANRGRLYEAEERWVDALYDYVQAITFVPDYEEALEAARRIVRDHPEALEKLQYQFEVEAPESLGTSETP